VVIYEFGAKVQIKEIN